MRIALFTDATSHPRRKKTAVAAVCFDVSNEANPLLLFQQAKCVPYCNSNPAEHLAAVYGLELYCSKELWASSLTHFTDSESVVVNVSRLRAKKSLGKAEAAHAAKLVQHLDLLKWMGCEVHLEQIPRILNRRADRLAHDALKGRGQQPFIPTKPLTVVDRYPFLKSINA